MSDHPSENSAYRIVLLIAAPDTNGTLRFPTNHPLQSQDNISDYLPGFVKIVPYISLEISMIHDVLLQLFGEVNKNDFVFEHHFSARLPTTDLESIATFLKIVRIKTRVGQGSWSSLPELIRSLPKERIRIPYLRAFQILMGVHLERTEALTVDELRQLVEGNTTKSNN